MSKPAAVTIAIVDDEVSVRRALLRLFRAFGFDAHAFDSGSAFLATLPHCRYDCLILDLHMPRLSGFDLQQDGAYIAARLPTVVISAHDDEDSRRRCLSAGAVAYLAKPFDDTTLLETVDSAIRERQERDDG